MMKHKRGDVVRVLTNPNTRLKCIAGLLAEIVSWLPNAKQYSAYVVGEFTNAPPGPYFLNEEDVAKLEDDNA